MSDIDKETKAIGEMAGIITALDEDQRGRVIRYIVERFNIAGGPRDAKSPLAGVLVEPPPEKVTGFEDFASLVDAARPETDQMRALVAGYWLQVCKGGASFDAQTANTELKHLGHPSANITMALGALINQKPALVLQLRKSGTSKQARKSYKVTEAGIRKVKAMLAGDTEIE